MALPVTYSADRPRFLEGKLSVRARLNYFIRKVNERHDLNAFVRWYPQEAMQRAKEIDDKIKNQTHGRLAGMIIGIKDNIAWKGHELNASSAILAGYRPSYSATVVERLLAEDAIILGYLNCDEFAMGSANEFSKYGRTKNPYDGSRTTGGSSGGPAAAVSAGLCHAALGSDTGGSVRQPAAFCGVLGLKPTYGLVSRYGLVTYASSLDQIGPLTHSPDDMVDIMKAISGPDGKDHTLTPSSALNPKKTGKAIGYFRSVIDYPGLDDEIKNYFLDLLKRLVEQGYQVVPIDFPSLSYLLPLYNVITTAEAAINLERYDGIRYGGRQSAGNWQDTISKTRTNLFGPEVKRKIMMGNTVLIKNEKYRFYDIATKVRNYIKAETHKIFRKTDVLISPTAPTVAHKAFGKKDVIERYKADIFTFHANLAGIASMSFPVFNHTTGMPFGIQLSGDAFSDINLLHLYRQIAPYL